MANQSKPTRRVRGGKSNKPGFKSGWRKPEVDVNPKHNDIRYYVPEGTLSHDIAAFPFGHLEGARFTFSGGSSPATITPPVIGIIKFHSVVDTDTVATNGATQSARTFYTWVRHQNSGHTNYDAPDLGIYLLATNECVKIATYCKRIYKLINTYSQDSRAIPVQIFEALGVTPSTLQGFINELPAFRGRVNYFIRRLSQFAFPSDVPLYSAQKFLIDDCFIDTHSKRRQYYWFEPLSWLQYDATLWPTGSALSRKPFTLMTYTSLLSMMDDFDLYLDALMSDEDINIMSGDILKAYRANNMESNLFSFTELDDLSTLEFKDDPNVLKRIHNATICGKDLSFGDVVQSSTGVLHSIIGGTQASSGSGVVIDASTGVQTTPVSDSYKAQVADSDITMWAAAYLKDGDQSLLTSLIYDDDEIPSSDDLIERTRLMVAVDQIMSTTPLGSTGTAYYYKHVTHGTEIIRMINFYAGSYTLLCWNNRVTVSAQFIECVAAYKHFPVCYDGGALPLPNLTYVSGRMNMWYDEFTIIPFAQLDLINKVVLFTELGVQSVVKVIAK